MPNENVLSARYATEPINRIFSERESNLYERRLWLAILKSQKELGMEVPQDLFLDRGAKRVYWVGMPRMGLSGFGPRMAKLNEIYKSEAAKRAPFVEYIDAWTLLDAPATTYQANLRQADGVHLNDAGALKSGGFVLKQIKKDWHIR